MGSNDVFSLALVCGTFVALGLIVLSLFGKRRQDPAQNRAFEADVVVRLNRIEQAIDTIAVEVERVSESQRFVTGLMADRGTGRLPT